MAGTYKMCGCPIDDLNREDSERCYYCDKKLVETLEAKMTDLEEEFIREHSEDQVKQDPHRMGETQGDYNQWLEHMLKDGDDSTK